MEHILTLSNLLSFSRVLLIAPFLYYLSFNTPQHNWMAFGIAILTILTDYFDGILARRNNHVTTFGKYIDPIADKLFVGAAVLYLTFYRGNMPMWFSWIVIGKDVLILLGGVILLRRGIVVQADNPGKITICAMSLVLILYLFNLDQLGWWAMLLTTLFVLHSTYFYTAKFVRFLRGTAP